MPCPTLQPASSVDPQDFLNALAGYVTSVFVVTTAVDGDLFGLTATSVTSVCATPPRLLACINGNAGSHNQILRAGRFCVNLLAEHQQGIARRFGGMDSTGPRFDPDHWDRTPSGTPRLRGAVAAFDCRLAEAARHHTHTVVFGDVLNIAVSQANAPLLYGARAFMRAERAVA